MKKENYQDVLASLQKKADRTIHLLLGNGFSMSYDSGIFSYNALHDFITKLDDEDLSVILKVVATRNFELIMRQLDNFSELIDAFGGDPKLKARVDGASEKLKVNLLRAVKDLHPEHVFMIPEEKSVQCSIFLKQYLDSGGKILSTNYDLLLYWVLMRNNVLDHTDGCGREVENPDDPPDDYEWSELVWGKYKEAQNVFYLHGALPFFDAGYRVVKEEYDEYNYLLEKISARMEQGEYPIFVTAGNGHQKLEHIRHNHYLSYCYDQLSQLEGSLVTFGFNFGEYDDHIIDAINRAAKYGRKEPPRLWSIYIGVYSEDDEAHIREIQHLFRCKVHIFDSSTAPVWSKGVV